MAGLCAARYLTVATLTDSCYKQCSALIRPLLLLLLLILMMLMLKLGVPAYF